MEVSKVNFIPFATLRLLSEDVATEESRINFRIAPGFVRVENLLIEVFFTSVVCGFSVAIIQTQSLFRSPGLLELLFVATNTRANV